MQAALPRKSRPTSHASTLLASLRRLTLAAGLASLCACDAPPGRARASSAAALSDALSAAPPPPAAQSRAPSVAPPTTDSALLALFQAFLDSSIVTRQDSSKAYVGRSESCIEVMPDEDYLLASGRALTVRRRGTDSATVTAELTSVGIDSTSEGGARRHVIVRVQTDTVEWDLLRDSTTRGIWQVCGYASTFRLFGPLGDHGLQTAWTPTGASWRTVARLADSVRRARGLAP